MFIHSGKPYVPRKPKDFTVNRGAFRETEVSAKVVDGKYICTHTKNITAKDAKKLADWLIRAATYIQYKEKE